MSNSEGKSTRNTNNAISDMNNHMQQTWQKPNYFKGKATKFIRRFTVRENNSQKDAVTTNQDSTGGIYLRPPHVNAATSPVPHLLQSNVPPSEDETLLIVQFIQHARLELENARLIKEASGTRSSELRYIANTVESHRAVLSAVRRVPLELLQEIFLHMIPHTSYEGYNSLHLDLQGDIPSWSFSQVSKFWRSAATHCPSLWRRLPHIHLDKRSTYKPDFVDILKRIMERTGDGPICVYFSSAKCDGPIDHPALDLLLAHSHRWRGARISLSLSSFHALRSVENRLPLLEGLIIHIVPTYCVRDEGFPETITFFRDAPSLCRAYIHGARAKIFALPQSYQLVEYQQEYCHPLQTHLALGLFQPGVSSFDSLTRLSITNFDPDNPWPNISLNNLVYLQIQFNHVTWLGWYLDALTLPCIEEIEISAHNPLLTASVSSILQRSHFPSTTLRRLYLRSPGYSATLELVALIRLAPFLTHLNVTTPPIEDLELLSTDASLAPCLQVCEFIASEEFPLTGEVIRQINIFAKLRCDLPQNIPTEENNDMEHLEHCMLIVYIHFDNYVPRNYAEQVHDWSADSQYLQELIELGRQLITASSVTRPFNGENKRSSRRKITSLLRKVNAYKVKTSKEIIISGVYSATFHCTYYPNKQVSLLAEKILKSWEPLLKSKSALDQLHWVLYNMQSLAYISQSNPTRLHSRSLSKLITGIQLLDCHPDYYSWPPIFI